MYFFTVLHLSSNNQCYYVCVGAYLAHDVGEDSSRAADQSTNDGHQRVVEHEALGTQRPARVAVKHRNNDRHVSTYTQKCTVTLRMRTYTCTASTAPHNTRTSTKVL
jgi:hypothetical protein